MRNIAGTVSSRKTEALEKTEWLPNCCWPSPAQWYLVPSPTGLVTMLTALGAFTRYPDSNSSYYWMIEWLLRCCWSSPVQWFSVPSPTGIMITFYSMTVLGTFRLSLSLHRHQIRIIPYKLLVSVRIKFEICNSAFGWKLISLFITMTLICNSHNLNRNQGQIIPTKLAIAFTSDLTMTCSPTYVKKLQDFSPQANYTDRATAACRQS
jgi:hypothetical protein